MAFNAITTGQDRADFIDQISLSSSVLAQTGVNNAQGDNTGLLDVRRWSMLHIYAECNDPIPTMIVTAVWQGGPNNPIVTGRHVWLTRQGSPIIDSIPNKGTFVTITITYDLAAAYNSQVVVYGRNDRGINGSGYSSAALSNPQGLVERALTAIGAGVQQLATFNFVQSGHATFNAAAGAAALVTIERLDVAGVWLEIANITLMAANGNRGTVTRVAIPSVLCRLRVVDTSGAANVVSAAVILGPD